ncbi:hypothetical protein Tco_1092731 [Tanacetum coccineum]|uniref:Uncharacterized protein n=1 Tax=Tanacetum coccineum TaxID=301880 RepID=A0ABQ5IAU0_9ASTR
MVANEDDEEEESSEEDDDEDKEEEHLALANSALPAIDSVPSAEETEPFETNESAATPPPPPQTIVLVSMTHLHRARISVRPHTPPSPSTEALIAEFASAPTPPSTPPSPLSPLSSLLYKIPSPPLYTSLMMTSNNVYFIASFIPYYYSEDQYAISIKEDTAYPCLHSPKTTEGLRSTRLEYGVTISIGYSVSSSLSNTAYSSQQINTVYPLPLDTAYQSSGTKTES